MQCIEIFLTIFCPRVCLHDFGPFFKLRNKTSIVFCCFFSKRRNKFPAEIIQYYLFTPSLGNWILELLRKFPTLKANAFFSLLIIQWFSKIQYIWSNLHYFSSGLQDQIILLLNNSLSLENCERSQKWQQPVPDNFRDTEEFFIEMCSFWITDWRANNEHSKFLGTESNLKGLPLTLKAASGYLDQNVWY